MRLSRFQSTRPLRGATVAQLVQFLPVSDFNPRAPCGARRSGWSWPPSSWYFNPRAPCGARRRLQSRATWWRTYFNPRAPCGARPPQPLPHPAPVRHFNPRAPCGARPGDHGGKERDHPISIHAPLAGRDLQRAVFRPAVQHFNPRAPCGARLHLQLVIGPVSGISIHAPLAGRDPDGRLCPGRPKEFQSTRPLRGATSPSRPWGA